MKMTSYHAVTDGIQHFCVYYIANTIHATKYIVMYTWEQLRPWTLSLHPSTCGASVSFPVTKALNVIIFSFGRFVYIYVCAPLLAVCFKKLKKKRYTFSF